MVLHSRETGQPDLRECARPGRALYRFERPPGILAFRTSHKPTAAGAVSTADQPARCSRSKHLSDRWSRSMRTVTLTLSKNPQPGRIVYNDLRQAVISPLRGPNS